MAEKIVILMGVLAGSLLFNVRSLTQPDCACEAPPASAEAQPRTSTIYSGDGSNGCSSSARDPSPFQ